MTAVESEALLPPGRTGQRVALDGGRNTSWPEGVTHSSAGQRAN